MTRLSLEYTVFVAPAKRVYPHRWSIRGILRFPNLGWRYRSSMSSSTVSHYCRDSLIYLSNRVHGSASRSLIPPLATQTFYAHCLISNLCFCVFFLGLGIHAACKSLFVVMRLFKRVKQGRSSNSFLLRDVVQPLFGIALNV